MFDEKFDVNEFEAVTEKRLGEIKEDYEAEAEAIADRMEVLNKKTEEEIIKEYLEEAQKKLSTLREDYNQKMTKARSRQEKEWLKTNYLKSINRLQEKVTASINWLHGQKDIDITCIENIRLKRELGGRSREEVIALYKELDEKYAREGGYYMSPEEQAIQAAAEDYTPMSERVDALRDMAELEIDMKKEIKSKIGKFINGIVCKLREIKVRKAYDEAMRDFEEARILVNYDYDTDKVYIEDAPNRVK